jgi:hypothetical protein
MKSTLINDIRIAAEMGDDTRLAAKLRELDVSHVDEGTLVALQKVIEDVLSTDFASHAIRESLIGEFFSGIWERDLSAGFRDNLRRLCLAAIQDEAWLVRSWGAESFGRWGAKHDWPAVCERASDRSEHTWVRADAIDAMVQLDTPMTRDWLESVDLTREDDLYVRGIMVVHSRALGLEKPLLSAEELEILRDGNEEFFLRLFTTLNWAVDDEVGPAARDAFCAMSMQIRSIGTPPLAWQAQALFEQRFCGSEVTEPVSR